MYGACCSPLPPGYYRRPDLTAEAFIDDPAAAELGGDGSSGSSAVRGIESIPHGGSDRWFCTGDVAALWPDGSVAIIDRVKNMFKLSQGEKKRRKRASHAGCVPRSHLCLATPTCCDPSP